MAHPVIVWFRRDLRLQDNPAFGAALETGRPVICLFVWEPGEGGKAAPGAASRVWLHHSLASLDESLRKRGVRLTLLKGDSIEATLKVARETKAGCVYWNRRYEPDIVRRDSELKAALEEIGVEAKSWNSSALIEPMNIWNSSKLPFRVFTPFWKACLRSGCAGPTPLSDGPLILPARQPSTLQLDELELLPARPWHGPMMSHHKVGETAAKERLSEFVAQSAGEYDDQRDIPGSDGTSMLSSHLHFGEIGPRQIVDEMSRKGITGDGARVFLAEVGWREFARYLLFHFPRTVDTPLRPEFERFPWEPDNNLLRRWQRGETGYPMVDAGMRQLWQTGWMHNRVRMITASFLVKHLLQPWQRGAEWFWDTLVDADLASNTLGWQWTAGCGADAAPFFRIFNPIAQGAKFDPKGEYVRRWVPELAGLPDKFIHQPWTAPMDVLTESKIGIGSNYPAPIVDHKQARARALLAYDKMRL